MNLFRLFLAIVFFVHENEFFGWNQLPQSAEECLADGIVVLLLALCFDRDRVT